MTQKQPASSESARVNRPERFQVEMQFMALDQMLPHDHRARVVWQYVESLDLEPLYAGFKSVQGNAGRNAIAPEILLALWLMATIDSISSARELDRRCRTDIVYMWICGNVSVNYHSLSEFRSGNAEYFEKMLTDSVTGMIKSGLVTLQSIGQDGMRVRASAGASSFRRQPSLEQLHQAAQEHVEQLHRKDVDDSDAHNQNARQRAAQKRAADERARRIAEAIEQVKDLREQKEKRQKGDGEKARCSTTDPDARRMKMGDGGTRPAYNFQFATDGDSRVIVAVDVTSSGSDRGQMAPMHEKVVETYGRVPNEVLVDSAFATKDDVTTVERTGSKVVSTVHGAESMERRGADPYARRRGDSDEYAAFRSRMGEEVWKERYKQRPGIAEFPNAECRNRGCRLLLVRGLERVRSVALLYASTINLMRMMNLGAI
jgi:transposase